MCEVEEGVGDCDVSGGLGVWCGCGWMGAGVAGVDAGTGKARVKRT